MTAQTIERPKAAALSATVTVNDLREALTWVSYAIPKRPAMPILKGVLLRIERGTMTVRAYDYEVLAEQTIAAPGGKGAALVEGTRLLAMLRVLPKGTDVQLRTTSDQLVLTSGDAGGVVTYRLPLMAVTDLPAFPALGKVIVPFLPGAALARLARVTVATGRDYTLPVLTGTLLQAGEHGGVEAAATDRYRLAVQAEPDVQWPEAVRVLIPSGVLAKVAQAYKGERSVTVHHSSPDGTCSSSGIAFVAGSRTLWTRTLEGEFPRYRTLLPAADAFTGLLAADRQDLLTAATQAGAGLNPHYLLLHAHREQPCTLTAGFDTNDSAQSDVQIPGVRVELTEDLTIGLNPAYLRAGLSALATGQVSVHVQSPTRPLVFQAEEDEHFRYLLMPVRLAR